MTRRFFAMFFLILASAFAQATGYIESFHQVQNGKYCTEMNFWLEGPVTGKVGYFGWALTGKEWSEGYAGLNYTVAKGVEVGVGAGVETNKNPLRIGTYLFASRGKFTGFAGYENGGSGYWDRVTTNYTLYKKEWFSVGAGVMHQAFDGLGPRYQVGLGKHVTIWGSVLIYKKTPTTMVALQWGF